jgi:hypothetical protein
MNMVTLDHALETVQQLPFDQQEMLLEIVQRRHIEQRRKEIAQDAQAALQSYRAGKLKPKRVAEAINELRDYLTGDEE